MSISVLSGATLKRKNLLPGLEIILTKCQPLYSGAVKCCLLIFKFSQVNGNKEEIAFNLPHGLRKVTHNHVIKKKKKKKKLM